MNAITDIQRNEDEAVNIYFKALSWHSSGGPEENYKKKTTSVKIVL
jgi:hypothetical protein